MLSAEALKEVDQAVMKYPADQKQSVVMATSTVAQNEKGWVSPGVMQFVAEYLEMPSVWVEEVTTFYDMCDIRPVGRFKLSVCTNLSCTLSGGECAANYLKKKLGTGFNKTTADDNFALRENECMGACGDTPAMIVNNTRMYNFISNEKLGALIADLQSKTPTSGADK